ncbi:MAG: hypothetical protein E7587_00380 [Ruminococcaceae bacterium]|nr:hypothetical protein [Oscillospiraceae bacterium]
MKINKITNSEFEEGSVSSLPIRPNRMSKYGEGGMSAEELKAAFDKNTELLREKINSLIDALYNSDTDLSVAADMKTGIAEIPTLKDVFESIEDGTLAAKIKLTDEYNLLNFATKVMGFLFPERAIEFVKVKKINGVYTLPSAPYTGHEEAIYLVPSNASLTLFNSYVWSGSGWELWSSGSLEGYLASLTEYIEDLSSGKADRSTVASLQRTKADWSEVFALANRLSASYSGSPFTYIGNLTSLNEDASVEHNRIYLLCCQGDADHGYWCYFNGYGWVKGGKYLADAENTATLNIYETLPVQSRSVKAFVDTCIIQALSQFTENCIGYVNVFDVTAISNGYINSNGVFIESEDYITTDYINAMAALRLYCSKCYSGKDGTPWNAISYCLYDINKNVISGSVKFNSSGLGCSIPIDHASFSGIRHIRVSFTRSSFTDSSRHMIEYSSSASDYSPFYDFRPMYDNRMNEKSENLVKNKVITQYINERTDRIQWIFGKGTSYPKFDTQKNKLLFNPNKSAEECALLLNGDLYRFEKGKSLEIDISPAATLDKNGLESDIGKICINTALLKSFTKDTCADLKSVFSVHGANSTLTSREYLPIATFRRSSDGFSAWMDCPFFIDDKLLGNTYSSDEIDAKLPKESEDSEEIITRAAAISAELDEVTEDDSIRFAVAFFSDCANTKKALALCRRISEKYKIPFLGLCGIGNELEELKTTADTESSIPVLATPGDGDFGAQKYSKGTLSTGAHILAKSDFIPQKEYKRVISHLARDYHVHYDYEDPNRLYCYTDFEDACIRVIFLNTADLPPLTKTISAGTAYTDRDGSSKTLTEDLETMKYDSLTTRVLCGPQLSFLVKECLDFSKKPNPREWCVITVQCAPTENWSSDGFPTKCLSKYGSNLEFLLTSFHESTSGGIYQSGDFNCTINSSFLSKGGKVIAGIYSGYGTDAGAVKSDIQRIACKDSAVAYPDTDGKEIICEIFSISRKKGRIDILRGGAGESRSYSFTPSVPKVRNERDLFLDYSYSYYVALKNFATIIMKGYSTNQYENYAIELAFPEDIDFNFKSRLILCEWPNSIEVAYPENLKFTGTDTSNGYFYPSANYRYTLDFWYDGIINAHVRGIKMS